MIISVSHKNIINNTISESMEEELLEKFSVEDLLVHKAHSSIESY